MNYLPRIVDSELDLRLRAVGATVIVGPKWCGKTTTAKQKAKSVLEMQDPDLQEGYLKLAAPKPSMLLDGMPLEFRLIARMKKGSIFLLVQ